MRRERGPQQEEQPPPRSSARGRLPAQLLCWQPARLDAARHGAATARCGTRPWAQVAVARAVSPQLGVIFNA